ncbi:efflux transporter outer membrane subunit [Chitinibacter tainanensis]|uniref:efflux transporter outer membrane subunit n=1 Tax=Chitinibacter tainanensis TaxID=230667 RepID=UPI0003F546D6|nr:efflux transporter outer membrane subunit [Chitinibacter tainanensis]
MRLRHSLIPLLAAGMLSACAVNLPAPTAAQLDPNANEWQASSPVAAKLAEQAQWWQAWQDPVLLQLQTAAQQDNPTLQLAAARIREARAKAYSAKAYLWPTLSGSASGTRAKNELMSPASVNNSGSVGLDASWEIDLWGGVRAAEQGLLANLAARTTEWHDARASMAAEVANAYVTYRAYQVMRQIVQQDLQSRERSWQLTQDKARVGLSSPVDVALLDASVAEGQAQLFEMQDGEAVAIKALVALTGLEESEVRVLLAQGEAALPAPTGFQVASLPAEVISQRPDIRIAAEQVKGAAADVGVAKVARLPSLSLFGAISVGEVRSGGSTTVSGTSWSFGPTLKLPIFNAGRLKSDQDAAEARYDQALANYQQLVRQAVREVEENMVRLDGAAKRVSATQRAVAGYQRQLDSGEAMWKAGAASLLDLEVSRRLLLGTQTRLISLQREQLAQWVALYKAVGGEWPLAAGEAQP